MPLYLVERDADGPRPTKLVVAADTKDEALDWANTHARWAAGSGLMDADDSGWEGAKASLIANRWGLPKYYRNGVVGEFDEENELDEENKDNR